MTHRPAGSVSRNGRHYQVIHSLNDRLPGPGPAEAIELFGPVAENPNPLAPLAFGIAPLTLGLAPPTNHASSIEVVPDDPRGSHKAGIPRDRRRDPVDVGRLEGGDLAEGMTPELAEVELDCLCGREIRRGRGAERAQAIATQRTRRIGRPGSLALGARRAGRRLTGWPRGSSAGRRGRSVAAAEGVGRVQAAGERPAGPRPGRAAAPSGLTLVGPSKSAGARPRCRPARAGPPAAVTERFIGSIDLGHTPCSGASRGDIGPAHVGVVLTGEPAPGGLDGGLAGPSLDAQHLVWIAGHHAAKSTGWSMQHDRVI
jgi:hypothetical protein